MSFQFHGQRPNEEVILFTKQHPFVLLKPLLLSATLFLFPLFLFAFMDVNAVLGVVTIVCVFGAVLWAVLALYSWNNTLLVVTNERLLFLEQHGLLHRQFTECGLGNIQQATHRVHGLLSTLAGYGEITVITAGTDAHMRLHNIPDPYDIQQEILRVANGD